MTKNLDGGAERKCAYSLCECQISSDETYCSGYCSEADKVHELEVQCDCEHRACVQYSPSNVRLARYQCT
jgi:hypothetical protein